MFERRVTKIQQKQENKEPQKLKKLIGSRGQCTKKIYEKLFGNNKKC